MKKRVFKNRIAALTVTAVLAFGALTGCGNKTDSKTNEGASDAVEITNVSYDPTRELYAAFAKWKCKPFRLAHCSRKERSLSTNGRIFDERDIRRMVVQALPLGSLFRANSPYGK